MVVMFIGSDIRTIALALPAPTGLAVNALVAGRKPMNALVGGTSS